MKVKARIKMKVESPYPDMVDADTIGRAVDRVARSEEFATLLRKEFGVLEPEYAAVRLLSSFGEASEPAAS
jgi:hypothetical protein